MIIVNEENTSSDLDRFISSIDGESTHNLRRFNTSSRNLDSRNLNPRSIESLQYKKTKDDIDKLNIKINETSDKVDKSLKDTTIEVEKTLNILKKEINADKSAIYTLFGIFATIITFLGTEIQVIKNTCDLWNILGMSFFLIGGLLTFILFLQYVTKSWLNDDSKGSWKDIWCNNSIKLVLIGIVVFCGIGILGLVKGQGQEEFCKYRTTDEIKEYIDSKYSPMVQQTNNNDLTERRLQQIETKLNIQDSTKKPVQTIPTSK